MKGIALTLALAMGAATTAAAANLYFYDHADRLIFHADESLIGKIAYEDNGTAVTVYDVNGNQLLSKNLTDIAYVTDEYNAPQGTILDIRFNDNGSATDLSQMNMMVQKFGNPQVRYSEIFKRNIASFDASWASTPTNYYKIDYAGNDAFENALKEGHTLEAVVMANYTTLPDAECKYFASHQGGGTGLMVCTKANGKNGLNELVFLPNVSTNGNSKWCWASSGIRPEKQIYYHVVGVWDKKAGKSLCYINGELVGEGAAVGNYNAPANGSHWFCVGGDAAPGNPTNGWNGDVVIARAYDHALTAEEAKGLWAQVADACTAASEHLVEGVSLLSLDAKPGIRYPICGTGFENGDKVMMKNADAEYLLDTEIKDKYVTVMLPADLKTGKYNFTLVRGNKIQELGAATLTLVSQFVKPADVIAHRGYWNLPGAAQNSRASLKNALAINAYGSETDIWITTDGHLMANHNRDFNNVVIETSTYDQVKNLTLSNGEKMPELQDFLEIIRNSDTRTKLIIEIKTHSNAANSARCAKAAVQAVKDAGVQDKVEYIAFSAADLAAVLEADPNAICAYLGSNYTPQYCHSQGHKGIDFNVGTYRSNPSYINEAHNLGMTVNAWTVSSIPELIETHKMGIEYITSDAPEEALLLSEYFAQ